MEQYKTFRVVVNIPVGTALTLNISAVSHWHAIDQAYNKLCTTQRDRTQYKIKKGGNK